MEEKQSSIITVNGVEIETTTNTKVRVKDNKNKSIFDNPVVQLFACIFTIILILGCLKFVDNLDSNNSNTNNNTININN